MDYSAVVTEVQNKYTFVNNNGIVSILRYGQPWKDASGDKAMLCLLQELEDSRENWRKLRERLEKDESLSIPLTERFDPAGTILDYMNELEGAKNENSV